MDDHGGDSVTPAKRLVAVVSGRASALDVAIRADALVARQVVSIVADRQCGALQMGASHGIQTTEISERANQRFSDALLAHCEEVEADYLVLLFNRLLTGELLRRYENRIVNIHRALLPAFKGLHGFDDNLRSGARFFGTTFHFIDENVDEGRIILQAAAPLDPEAEAEVTAHAQFQQMCKGLIQVCHWLEDERLDVLGERVLVRSARYDQPDFSPALEAAAALKLVVPRSAG